MKTVQQPFQIKPVSNRQHLLFNLLNFLYFRKREYEGGFAIESQPIGPFLVIPYVLFSELYFFRQRRYFFSVRKRIVGILALQEKPETLYISSLAVSPFSRKIGIATHMLNFASILAEKLEKRALELSVLKANTPALRLHLRSGFVRNKKGRRSFILRKNLQEKS